MVTADFANEVEQILRAIAECIWMYYLRWMMLIVFR